MQSQFRQLEPPPAPSSAASPASLDNERSSVHVTHEADGNNGDMAQPSNAVARVDDVEDGHDLAPDWLDELFGSDDDADVDADLGIAVGTRARAPTVAVVETSNSTVSTRDPELPCPPRRKFPAEPPASKRSKVERESIKGSAASSRADLQLRPPSVTAARSRADVIRIEDLDEASTVGNDIEHESEHSGSDASDPFAYDYQQAAGIDVVEREPWP